MESTFRYLVYLLFVLTTLSCNVSEVETELDIPYKGDFLVFHGFINQAEGVRLVLQKTVAHSCTTCSDSVSNAVVSLYENGAYLFGLNTYDGYWYYSPSSFSPVMGNKYQIKAEADNMPTAISSSLQLMKKVSVDTAYVKTTDNLYKIKVHYRFTDIPDERNHYMVRVVSAGEDGCLWDKNLLYNKVIGDEVAKNGVIEGESIYFLNDEHEEIQIVLYHISSSMVQYIYSLEDNFFSEDDPFSEYPVPVYNNISNGYGFLGAFASDSYAISF